MSQQRDVGFDTIFVGNLDDYNINEDNYGIEVKIQPESISSPIVQSFLNLNSFNKTINNNETNEGELCILMRNQLEHYIDVEINENCELIIHGVDAEKYSIDEDGYLIYKEE